MQFENRTILGEDASPRRTELVRTVKSEALASKRRRICEQNTVIRRDVTGLPTDAWRTEICDFAGVAEYQITE